MLYYGGNKWLSPSQSGCLILGISPMCFALSMKCKKGLPLPPVPMEKGSIHLALV